MKNTFPLLAAPHKAKTVPIILLTPSTLPAWLKKQGPVVKNWLAVQGFTAAPASLCTVPNAEGKLHSVVCGVEETLLPWSIAHLPGSIPAGNYHLESGYDAKSATHLALGWVLATYEFTRYRKAKKTYPALVAPKGCDAAYVRSAAEAIFWARDLINTPANDMHPDALAKEAADWARGHKASVKIIRGEELLKQNYPMIYAVGKAASVPPQLVDIRFGRKGAPKVTLVGKGVTFDSGGLDIKSAAGMKMMKKDMGGAASVLALARMIVEAKLPVQLRVLLPIVENAIAGNAMRPLDIINTRKGLTVEIGNTDAEGRLILCDALFEADSESPDLLIDCATLTGAARVALGTDVPAFFTNDETLAHALSTICPRERDPIWPLPLWQPYRKQLDTQNADLSNDPDSSYGGAITAALYLQEFVSRTTSWLHIDMMAWNLQTKPGRPIGGEAMAVRSLYALIKERYGN